MNFMMWLVNLDRYAAHFECVQTTEHEHGTTESVYEFHIPCDRWQLAGRPTTITVTVE